MESLIAATHQNYPRIAPYVTSSASWSITVSSFNRSLSATSKSSFRNQLQFLPFQGAVNLRQPDLPFYLLLEYVPLEKHQLNDPEELLPPPLHCYFGLALAQGGMHEVLSHFIATLCSSYLHRRPRSMTFDAARTLVLPHSIIDSPLSCAISLA